MFERAIRRRSAPRALVTLATTAAITAGMVAFAGTAGAAPSGTDKSFPSSIPSWAVAKADAGATTADTTVEGEVFLPLRNEQGAQALAAAVSTPGSSKYGKYLTPAQWISTYSPTQADFNAVKQYIVSSGLTITGTPLSRQYIVYRGPAAAADAAFKTSLHNYHFAGSLQYAPSSVPALPASVGNIVASIAMDSSRLMTKPTDVKPDGSTLTATPKTNKTAPTAVTPLDYTCDDYYGETLQTTPLAYGKTAYPGNICGYTPDQLRSGYGLNKIINAGNDGTGQTIAIIDAYASSTIQQDTNDYMRQVGSPLLLKFKQIIPATKDYTDVDLCQGVSGWNEEQTLDVQSAHSIAPGASILYVGGTNCGGGLDIAMSTILDSKLANIVSNSYGDLGEGVPGAYVTGEQDLQLQAVVEGIGLYFSSGDDGDDSVDLGYTSPDFPASSPWVTAVGGTSLAVGANGAQLFQTGWGSTRDQINQSSTGKLSFAQPLPGTFYAGAGGGTSALFAQPFYQKGIVPTKLADSVDGTPSRVVPDISAIADPYTGFQLGIRLLDDATGKLAPFGYETIGGTSLASPVTAAEAALTQQLAGQAIGFANPALYALDKAAPSAFQDVAPTPDVKAVTRTSPSTGLSFLVTLDRDSSLKTAKGYDNVTGIGTLSVPTIAALIKGLHS